MTARNKPGIGTVFNDRQLALAILLAVVAVFLLMTILPVYLANASRQARLDDINERLQRYEQIAARDRDLLPQYEARLAKQKVAGNHLRSETAALAGAELQRLVKSISAANQAQIQSTQILPVGEEQGFQRVAIKVRLRGTLPAILASFYDLETSDLYLFVDNVNLSDNRIGRSKAELRQMEADFDLVAYMPEES